jgi:hypothetical protein
MSELKDLVEKTNGSIVLVAVFRLPEDEPEDSHG